MAGFVNQSGALFVLPDGVEVPNGATVDLDAATAEIAGVAQMIEAGKLVAQEVKRGRKPKAAGDDTVDGGAGNDTVDGGNDTIVAD